MSNDIQLGIVKEESELPKRKVVFLVAPSSLLILLGDLLYFTYSIKRSFIRFLKSNSVDT